jgi:hypothetical protein
MAAGFDLVDRVGPDSAADVLSLPLGQVGIVGGDVLTIEDAGRAVHIEVRGLHSRSAGPSRDELRSSRVCSVPRESHTPPAEAGIPNLAVVRATK